MNYQITSKTWGKGTLTQIMNESFPFLFIYENNHNDFQIHEGFWELAITVLQFYNIWGQNQPAQRLWASQWDLHIW